jgi:transcriptional regulator with XRE-family HTH domain
MPVKPELSEFLRSRRERLRPVDVGLPDRGQRRVPGLRREEVATLAGVSTDYYVRLEQGRNITASADVLDALARALQLDDAERLHLHDLAKPQPFRRSAPPPQRVRPGVRLLLDSLDTPAFVLGRRMDILATNRMCRALLADFDAMPAGERNHARWVFLDPRARELYGDWQTVARENVAILRMDAGRHPDDERLAALIGELSVKSPEFARWWADHDVLVRGHGTKRYQHPIVGDVEIRYEALQLADEDQTLFIYNTEPGSASAQALSLLDSWSATPDAPAPPLKPTPRP